LRHRRSGKSILHVTADGYAWLRLLELKSIPPFNEKEQARELRGRFEAIPGRRLPNEDLPYFSLSDVALPEATRQILALVAWIIDELDRAAAK
jgi:hypothetical protein